MKIVNLKTTIAALAVLALTIPAAGSAHPSLYLITGKIANKAEVQTLTVDATGGTYKPSAGAKTIPWNAPSWQVQDALGFDGAIGRNAVNGQANVLVTGLPGGPYTLRFQGSLATTNVAPLAPSSTGLTGGTATASITPVIDGSATNTTYATDPTGATLQDTPQQALIVNDGYATLWTESNGLSDHGWLNLKFMPGGFRAPMTGLQWITYTNVQTGIQTHATCQNVPALNTDRECAGRPAQLRRQRGRRSVLELRSVAEDDRPGWGRGPDQVDERREDGHQRSHGSSGRGRRFRDAHVRGRLPDGVREHRRASTSRPTLRAATRRVR